MFFIEQNNFLSEDEKQSLDSAFWFEGNTWFYQPITLSNLSSPGVIDLKNGYDICYFTFEPKENSKQYNIIKDVIVKFLNINSIDYVGIIRIKLNITPTHDEIKQSPPHSDSKKPHLNFIYYISDAEGETVLYNELANYINNFTDPTIFKKIKPQRGKAILFDGRQFHSVTPPSKFPLRAVINALIEIKQWPNE